MNLQELWSFYAYNAEFSGGVSVASGDVNGDGFDDIITGAGPGGGPHVRVLSGRTLEELGGFHAYGAFTGGVFVAAGDVNGDGRADVITGAGAGGGPHVRVFDGATYSPIRDWFAFDTGFRGGIRVAAGDINGDGLADVIVGAGIGAGPHVRAFDGRDLSLLTDRFAFPQGPTGGVWVGFVPPTL